MHANFYIRHDISLSLNYSHVVDDTLKRVSIFFHREKPGRYTNAIVSRIFSRVFLFEIFKRESGLSTSPDRGTNAVE